ncbi:hypothetical protein GLOIN_2v1739063 [Rhizophagus irregularis DAOM 181602=DAOM 197198]|uniref:Uncharacterized protein n=1 Tax=Rhizophagus irregularis (strain DAOM 181602 / DAOM 197198 / MUCL 43194) TaxID=747089 RepID=A0A2P4NVJ8_RHIID|nr:hypothetical protein GLOIN_2v1739063 [Rhizophagus irregularis DAOM 181602=DAOM 197198]POG57098.1 hypothetical protein GLOIN_2v1739063 [Rhizophagus irregularis DAOM 181602=DAOM 197198]GET53707.1 hypothetical protein GLOIN_2v1739063 [Rhizophagus irregularis DAOM 181602=DAOM 197198]|eukprot:XP_025164381.1 hypothetical protein GLOIN_2v1739063 [Rhizophagus irregularis DAOM 181602=DAOM 197198]
MIFDVIYSPYYHMFFSLFNLFMLCFVYQILSDLLFFIIFIIISLLMFRFHIHLLFKMYKKYLYEFCLELIY